MSSRNLEAADWQELIDPTVQTEVIISHSPRRVTAGPRRRAAEEKFWNGLTADETRAAEEIYRVWQYITAGMTAGAQRYERTDRGHDGPQDLPTYLRQAYRAWRMRLRPMERSAFISVLFHRMSQQDAARAYQRRSTWPRENIGRCLAAWVEVRGWA